MNILYVGRHNQGNNDDEGSITRAFQELGHNVTTLDLSVFEDEHFVCNLTTYPSIDFVLYHKIPVSYVKELSRYWPCVFWFFDPLGKGFYDNDKYVYEVTPFNAYSFFTDGDYVVGKKGILLRQGFDDWHNPPALEYPPENNKAAFLGTVHLPYYRERYDFLKRLTNVSIYPVYDTFKGALTQMCQVYSVMLGAPPVTDNYWSNRVYLLGGRGACLLHPFSSTLKSELGDALEYFTDAEDAQRKLNHLLQDTALRHYIRVELRNRVLKSHTYKHRVEELIQYLE